ncbi:MAG: PAS domain S-box protein [Myxococcales bacterium]|nr:PAS domain S-box protein [Myxococcales bacterium]
MDSRLQQLIDAVGDAMLVIEPGGPIVGCNDAAARVFGYPRAQLLQLTRKDLVRDDDRLAMALAERVRTGSFRGELTLVRNGGEPFDAEVTNVALFDDGAPPRSWLVVRDLADRRRAEMAASALSESNELLQALADAAFEAVLIHRDGEIIRANGAAERAARVEAGGLVGKKLFDFIAPASRALAASKIAARSEEPYEALGLRSDGSVYPLEVRVRLAAVQVGGAPARVVALRDISDRRALEEQVRQSQKMEAIGRLAGGVAHDFNNLLAVILGATTLAEASLPPGHRSGGELAEVRKAAERGAALTRQLLSFGRKQIVRPRVIDLRTLLVSVESLLRKSLTSDAPRNVTLRIESDAGCRIKADPGQVELALLNLVINARDALTENGEIVITTQRHDTHVVLSVSDTGVGIDASHREHIFEPFFTTKGPDKGTGLGLYTVFGIVQQSGGSIQVESDLGRGSTFVMRFPASDEPIAEPDVPRAIQRAAPLTKTVLLADDEPQVRRVLKAMLEEAGYTVLDAASGSEALALARAHGGVIDLLLTDFLMPKMTGRELAEALVAERVQTRVLYMSGFVDEKLLDDGPEGLRAARFLAKPFSREALLATVASVLA